MVEKRRPLTTWCEIEDYERVVDGFARRIDFPQGLQLTPGPSTFCDRDRYTEFHWQNTSPAGRDRLIRNLRVLKGASHCTGFAGQ